MTSYVKLFGSAFDDLVVQILSLAWGKGVRRFNYGIKLSL